MSTPLPYGPAMTAALAPLRRAFRVFNQWVAAPLIRAGGGPLLTTPVAGSILLLRTTGRKSGLTREAPLGYTAIRSGPFDPGRVGTRINTALWVLLPAVRVVTAAWRRKRLTRADLRP